MRVKNGELGMYFVAGLLLAFVAIIYVMNSSDNFSAIEIETLNGKTICIKNKTIHTGWARRGTLVVYNDSITLNPYYLLESGQQSMTKNKNKLVMHLEVGDCITFSNSPRDTIFLKKEDAQLTFVRTSDRK